MLTKIKDNKYFNYISEFRCHNCDKSIKSAYIPIRTSILLCEKCAEKLFLCDCCLGFFCEEDIKYDKSHNVQYCEECFYHKD